MINVAVFVIVVFVTRGTFHKLKNGHEQLPNLGLTNSEGITISD